MREEKRSTDGAGNQPHLQHGHSCASHGLPRVRVSRGCYSREGSIPWIRQHAAPWNTAPGRRDAQSHPPPRSHAPLPTHPSIVIPELTCSPPALFVCPRYLWPVAPVSIPSARQRKLLT